MFEFDRFRSEVLNDYIAKKDNSSMSTRLSNPSPANLRDYAISCVKDGLTANDMPIFQEFFNPEKSYENIEKAIRKTDLGKMKSVQNFLIGNTKEPSEIIVKLSAVLIDFQPRPYHKWRAENLENEETDISETTDEKHFTKEKIEEKPNIKEENENIEKPRNLNWLSKLSGINKKSLISIMSVALIPISFITYNQLKTKHCAYWDGEQYISIDCGESLSSHVIIRVNDGAILNLKKITRPDTLTKKDKNKLWYSKINNEVEFFTYPGAHPIHKDKRLKPATEYIIQKYGRTDSLNASKYK